MLKVHSDTATVVGETLLGKMFLLYSFFLANAAKERSAQGNMLLRNVFAAKVAESKCTSRLGEIVDVAGMITRNFLCKHLVHY